MNVLCEEQRLRIIGGDAPDLRQGFADDLRAGLSASPKSISCRFFYDAEGSRLFSQICEQPEYYLTRAEASILRRRATELVERIGVVPELIELGSGSAEKTQILIDAFLARHEALCFRPIDISIHVLVESSRELLDRFDRLQVHGFAAEYVSALEELHREQARDSDVPRLVLWLGSSIGNFERFAAVGFLQRVRGLLNEGDRMLVGFDLRKATSVLEAAYDDAAGVTARFNKNILDRANRELGANFELDRFVHRVHYDEVEGRIEMYLDSLDLTTVTIESLGLSVPLRAGEPILTEYSHKYSPSEIETLVRDAGFELEVQWTDERERFALVLLHRA